MEDVLSKIKRDEITKLALDLGNIDSPLGYEKEVGEFIFSWLKENGLSPRKIGMFEDRFNVVGEVKGDGTGYNLIYNGHMDTVTTNEDVWIFENPTDRLFHRAWLDGSKIYGFGVVNDKGPLAATLIAAKAIKEAGAKLKGDLIVTAVCSETARNPVDEFKPPKYVGKHTGAEYMVSHGVIGDYAMVAEATNRGYTWAECGYALYKINIRGLGKGFFYTPYLQRPTEIRESSNPIVRMAAVIQKFEDWAFEYEKKHTYKFVGGEIIPKAAIEAVRGGEPTAAGTLPAVCALYAICFLPPDLSPMLVQREIEQALSSSGVPVTVENYAYNPGYEGKNVSKLTEYVEKENLAIFGEKCMPITAPLTSMWRDVNVFNGAGIPSITYGPGMGTGMFGAHRTFYIESEELYNFAKIYALLALDVCTERKS